MKHKQLLILIGAVLLVIAGYIAFKPHPVVAPEVHTQSITTFEDCKSAGYPVMESYPAQCRTPEGKLFTEVITVPATTTSTVATPEHLQLTANFGTKISLNMHDSVKLTDGLLLELLSVNDSRCKEGVQCIWAGELTPTLRVTGGNFGTASAEVRLGTVTAKTYTQKGYTITLTEGDTASATITVAKTSPTTAKTASYKGYIGGHVTIGPICPVEDIAHPCPVPEKAYTSRNIVVYWPNQVAEIKRIPLTNDGSYKIALDPGTYWVRVEPAGIIPLQKVKMVVETGKTTSQNFSIDTGIR